MNFSTPSIAHALTLTMSLFAAAPAQALEPGSGPPETALTKTEYKFSNYAYEGGWQYSTTFGLSLFDDEEVKLSEVVYNSWPISIDDALAEEYQKVTSIDKSKLNPLFVKHYDQLQERGQELITRSVVRVKEMAARKNLNLITDYQKLNAHRQLGFDAPGKTVVLMRIRKELQLLNEGDFSAANDATFGYMDDSRTGSGSAYHGALMLDIYNDVLYNRASRQLRPGWIVNPFRVWFRVGAEFEHNDMPGQTAVDMQKYMGLVTFTANPDQNAKFLNIRGAEITSPQLVQLGAVLTRNLVSGVDDTSFIFGWQPRLRLDQGFGRTTMGADGIEMQKSAAPGEKPLFKGFAFNQPMYFVEGHFPMLYTAEEGQAKSNWFSFVNPNINLETASGAKLSLGNLAGNAREELKKFMDSTLQWDVTAGIGRDLTKAGGKVVFTVGGHGIHPLSDLGSSRMWYDAKIALSRARVVPAEEGVLKVTPWSDTFSAYVSYQSGDLEGAPGKADLLTAGMGIRF